MTRLMQTASALTLAAALSAAPVLAYAQQATGTTTETEVKVETQGAAEQAGEAVDNAAAETGEAAQDAGQAVEGAAENAGQAIENAGQEAAQETGEVLQEAGQTLQNAGQEGEAATTTTVEGTTTTTTTTEIQQPDGTTVAVEGDAAAAVEPVEGTIRMQDDNSILTSDLHDASIYNAQGEKIGNISDAIVSLDGTVEGVVIGVGGFLGLGEKKVAVEMQQISLGADPEGKPQLILDSTKEALEAAPEFVTSEDQAAAQQAQPGQVPAENAPAGTIPPATTEMPATETQGGATTTTQQN